MSAAPVSDVAPSKDIPTRNAGKGGHFRNASLQSSGRYATLQEAELADFSVS